MPILVFIVFCGLIWWAYLRPPPDPSGPPTEEVKPVSSLGAAELVAVGGPHRGRRWDVDARGGRGFLIGRGDQCQAIIGGEIASRVHAAVTIDSGQWQIYDQNSANGTYLNGQRIDHAPLSDGEIITIGDSQLQFRLRRGQPMPSLGAAHLQPVSPQPLKPAPPGLVIPGYENYRLQEIARGMSAVVLKGTPVGGGEPIAVKVLTNVDPYLRDKFSQEAQLLEQLRHPHIVPAYAKGRAGGQIPYIVMEYCGHGNLHDRLVGQPLPEEFVRLVGRQVCEALAAAHQYGVVHRDIKPANLLFAAPQHVKVADFGIARWAQARATTVHGTVLGTVTYMSPEQAQGGEVSAQSDIYSLGVVMYEMLAGRPPFTGELTDVMHQHVKLQPPALSGVSSALAGAVMRALAKDPAQRHASAAAFAQAFGGAAFTAPSVPGQAGQSRVRLIRVAPQQGAEIAVHGATVLGRPQLNPDDVQMSQQHARIVIQGGLGWIEDLNSTNGTWVNHQRVAGWRLLRSGDQLKIGNSVFLVEVSS